MRSTPVKVLFAAVICYVSAYLADYVSKIPQPPPPYAVMMCAGGDPWSVWNYLALITMVLALGLTIAGIKLMRR